jgi:hypothetical protein
MPLGKKWRAIPISLCDLTPVIKPPPVPILKFGSIGSVAGTTSLDNITFIFTSTSRERTVHFTGKFSRNSMHGMAIAYDNGTYVSGPHNWTAQRQ